VHLQSAVVLDKPNFLNRFIKKLTRDRLCNHSCQNLLTALGNYTVGLPSLP